MKTEEVSYGRDPDPTDGDVKNLKYHTIEVGEANREFAIYLPPSYDDHTPSPLLLCFHGYGRTMDQLAAVSRFNDPLINPNMIAVFLQGQVGPSGKRAWQGAPYAAPGVDDIAFTSAVLTFLREHYCIDDSRIYALGKSNGGGFCDLLASSSTVGSNFAAFAMASAALYHRYTSASTVVPLDAQEIPLTPILELHGANDETIKYDGDEVKLLPSIPSWLDTWARRNGSRSPASEHITVPHGSTGKISHTTYKAGDISFGVEHYRVEGMGHLWPKQKRDGVSASKTDRKSVV